MNYPVVEFLLGLEEKERAKTLPEERRSKNSHPLPHSYQLRLSPSGKETYYCSLPGCAHCLNIPHQVIGRETLCSACLYEKFVVEEDRRVLCLSCQRLADQEKGGDA